VTLTTFRILLLVGASCSLAAAAGAQELGRCQTSKQMTIERLGPDHVKLIGLAEQGLPVEIRCGEEAFFADAIEIRSDINQLIATGNVVFTSGSSRIAADRAEFNTETRTGTFFQAWGSASLGGPEEDEERSHFGTQEADIYFYGKTVEKVGPKKYRVTKGGFTTCVQPQPRWELTSSSVTVNLDEYAILRNSLFKVKGVPVLYLPIFYYPVQEDDRATGFLLPSYGTSTIRGQSLSNAFFWAINRSQDATFMHDWYTKTGQGYGGEYRYIRGPGSEGQLRTYLLRETGAEYVGDDGETTATPERRSYEVRGALNQRLGRRLRARARADYFSDITVQQTYNQNIYEASRRQRVYSGSLTGNWREYSVVGSFDRNQYFYGTDSSTVRGGAPRIVVTRGERPLFGSPVYLRVNGDYNRLVVQRKTAEQDIDQGLTRVDLFPRIRVPFTRWPFLTVNSSFAFRSTYWTESEDEAGAQIERGIGRHYYEAETQITGPVFNRIWTFEGSRYAEKLKHSVEPFLNIERVSGFDEFDRIVRLDSVDNIIGGTTRMGYGIANRLYRKPPGGGTSREILNATLGQTYYTDAEAARYDRRYRTSVNGLAPSNFSPLALDVRAWPAERFSATFHAEYDTRFKAFRSMSADGSLELRDWLQTTAGWSQRRFIAGLPGFDDPEVLDHYLNASTNIRLNRNRYGASHTFNFDVGRKSFLQQRLMLYYNAQCCGFSVEYQHYDLNGLSFAPVPEDRRFNFSVTLAGIGGFGNFFGALGGAPDQRY
jgi:LPS-assembly protein